MFVFPLNQCPHPHRMIGCCHLPRRETPDPRPSIRITGSHRIRAFDRHPGHARSPRLVPSIRQVQLEVQSDWRVQIEGDLLEDGQPDPRQIPRRTDQRSVVPLRPFSHEIHGFSRSEVMTDLEQSKYQVRHLFSGQVRPSD